MKKCFKDWSQSSFSDTLAFNVDVPFDTCNSLKATLFHDNAHFIGHTAVLSLTLS